MFLPLLANSNYIDKNIPEVEPFIYGVTLQMFIPIGHRRTLQMNTVLVNGEELAESPVNGYELIRGTDGWHLFLNLPPERTCRENIYHILARYDIVK